MQFVRRKIFTSLCAASLLLNVATLSGSCQSASPELRSGIAINNYQRMDGIDHQIVQKEIDLLRLNAAFRNHYTEPNKWKQRRLKFYDMAAGGVANAGDITLLSQFWHYHNKVGQAVKHKGSLQSGAIIVLVAYLTLGGLYGAEGVADIIGDFNSIHEKFDAKSMRDRVATLKGEIDALFESRRKIAIDGGALSGTDQEIESTEERVLTGVRDQALTEFARLYIDSRKKHTQRDITTIGTMAVCATGAFPGAYGVIRGLESINLKKVGGGGIGFIVSGSTLTAAPVLIHGGAAISAAVAAKKMSAYLAKSQEKTEENLAQDTTHLSSLLAGSSVGTSADAASRVNAYKTLASVVSERKSYLESERKRDKRDMIESFVTYAIKGVPQIVFGSFVAQGGYRYVAQPDRALKDVAIGATVNEVSWGCWMMDTFQRGARNEHFFGRDAKENPFIASNDKLSQLDAWRH